LPSTILGAYIESRVNSFLQKNDAGAGEVTIKVLTSNDKEVEVKSGMKRKYVKMSSSLQHFIMMILLISNKTIEKQNIDSKYH